MALVVFAILTLGLARGVDFGRAAWDRQSAAIAARSELDAVDRALRGLIAGADPGAGLTGEAHALAFTSRLPESAALATRAADLALGVDAAHRLVLRWTPHLHAARIGPPPAPHTAVLLEGVARLDLAYWAAAGWRDAWTGRDPPAMVRLRIVFVPGDPRHWADIVAAPQRGNAA